MPASVLPEICTVGTLICVEVETAMSSCALKKQRYLQFYGN